MKRLITFCLFTLAGTAAIAQTGSWYIGGAVGYNSNSDKAASGFTTTTSGWAFAPEVGTFLKDDIQLGLYVGLSGSSVKDDNGDISSTSSMTPTIYGRKFFKITDEFSAFMGLYLGYISDTNTIYGTPNNESKGSGISARFGVGVAYALSPRFTAVGQYGLLGYSNVSFENNGVDAGSESNLDFGVNTIGYGVGQGGGVFNIGLYYTFKTAN